MDSPWLNSLIRWKNQQEITDTASRISWEQKSVQLGNGHHGWNAKYAYICWISICLSIYLSIDRSVCLIIYRSIDLFLPIYLSIYPSTDVYLYIFIYSLAMQNHKHKYTYINAVWLHIRTCISPFFHHISPLAYIWRVNLSPLIKTLAAQMLKEWRLIKSAKTRP